MRTQDLRVKNASSDGGPLPNRLLLTSKEAAAALSVSERTLFTLKKNGTIPHVQLKGSVRYHLPSVEKALFALQVKSAAQHPIATTSPSKKERR